jgi:universal stress protein A
MTSPHVQRAVLRAAKRVQEYRSTMNMKLFQTILCPIDFSEQSLHALGHAALLATRNSGQLVALFVEDPMLASAAAVEYDEASLLNKSRAELQRLVEQTAAVHGLPMTSTTIDVAVGKAHEEIVRSADRLKCDLIVMGSHGRTGASRVMVGSTTHRVLRDSSLPVLATPLLEAQVERPSEDWPGKWALAPLDLGARDRADALAAAVSARELGVQLQLVHVVEPIASVPWLELDETRRNEQRHRKALAELNKLKATLSWAVTECHVAAGKPADEIARLASSSAVGLVIMTRRRGKGVFGPKQGSISYEVLTRAKTAVLALPSDKKWLSRAVSLAPERG